MPPTTPSASQWALRSLYATQKTPSACQRSYHICIAVRSCPEKRWDGLSSV